MSWFTELAGKAEEFLNKVDKGAASALSGENNLRLSSEPLQYTSGRTGSTSSEPISQPTPTILRKGSSPDLGAYSARSKPAPVVSGSSGGSPRGARPAGHKKTLSNTVAAAADHTVEDLLEFLNAPTQKKPSNSAEVMSSSTSATPEPSVAEESEGNMEAEQNGAEDTVVPAEPKVQKSSDQLDATSENALLRNEIQSLNREISQMFNKVKSNGREVSKMRQELERERETLRRVNSRLREMEDRENDLSQLLEAKDSQVSVLKVRLNEAEEKLRMAESHLDATKVENERILQASTESSSFHSNTVETLRKQVEDLEDALGKEREATRIRNQEHMRKISELEEAQTSLAASVAEYENRAEVQAQTAEKRRHDLAIAESRIEQAQRELSDYKQKAQRILQSKEKLIATLKAGRNGGDSSEGGGDASESMEMEQLRQERDLLREETGKQQAALDALKVQINDLEVGNHNALAAAQDQLRYQNELMEEERTRTRELQVQCSQLNDELVFLREDLTQQKFNFAAKMQDRDVEIEKLRKQLMAKKMSSVSQAEVETRLQALTQNLLQKQTLIEQLTTEKSTLSHQIERMERQRRDVVTYRPGANGQDTYLMINTTDDGTEQSMVDIVKSHIPSFMVESPLDGRMARRVKRVYSTLDTFSIRLGVFLRRFPIARVMVLAYMGLLHLWVMIVLLTYQPEIHETDYAGHHLNAGSEPRP